MLVLSPPGPAPKPLLDKVSAGKLGRKTGEGFWKWAGGQGGPSVRLGKVKAGHQDKLGGSIAPLLGKLGAAGEHWGKWGSWACTVAESPLSVTKLFGSPVLVCPARLCNQKHLFLVKLSPKYSQRGPLRGISEGGGRPLLGPHPGSIGRLKTPSGVGGGGGQTPPPPCSSSFWTKNCFRKSENSEKF